MKVINKTHFRTDDLRRILQRVAEEELETTKRKRLRVEVRYTRGEGCSGLAHTGRSYCIVRLWKHGPDAAMFASVAAHEYAHLRGMSHVNMPTRYKWASPTWRARYEWAREYGIRRKDMKKRTRPDVETKLAHAEKMHTQALTRQKRATTIAKKWAAKIRYYSKRRDSVPTAAETVIPSISTEVVLRDEKTHGES
jgi:hypothetical protein